MARIMIGSKPKNKPSSSNSNMIKQPSTASTNEQYVWYQMHRMHTKYTKFVVSNEHSHTFFVVVWILCARAHGIAEIRNELLETYAVLENGGDVEYFFDEVLKKWGETYVLRSDIKRLFSRRFETKVEYRGKCITFKPGNLAYVPPPDINNVDEPLRVLFGNHLSRMIISSK